MSLHSLHYIQDALDFVLMLWPSPQLAMVYLRILRKYEKTEPVHSPRAWLERPISPISDCCQQLDSTNILLQVTILSYPDYVPYIWSTHSHSWITAGFLSIPSTCKRSCVLVDHSVSNAVASSLCLSILLLFTFQVDYAFFKKAF